MIAIFGLVLFVASSVSNEQVYDEGHHCVWYDTCGKDSFTQGEINCAYNGTAKPLTDEKAKKVYQEYCPDLYNQKTGEDPLTCCSAEQLFILQSNMDVPKQVLSRCPSCFHNFVNLYCYFTCAPDHSKFLRISKTEDTPEAKNKSTVAVKSVDCNVTNYFANGMYNSCKDVQMPSFNERALGILCGHSADECTPSKWLTYLGSTANGQTPFQINFRITDKSAKLPDGETLSPMNATIVPCSSPVGNKSRCSCQDCWTPSCPSPQPPMIPVYPCTTGPEKHTVHRRYAKIHGYQSFSLIIQRRDHATPIKHLYPPPSMDYIMFNPIFNKTFLSKSLDLLNTIQFIKFPFEILEDVTLEDICQRGSDSKHCIISSFLQYYQNSRENINKIVMDSTGFFVMADYLDHALVCFRDPALKMDMHFNMPCVSDYGDVVSPYEVFCGYDGHNYQNATALVITYVIKNPHMSQASAAWRSGVAEFLTTWQMKHTDIAITLYQPQQ